MLRYLQESVAKLGDKITEQTGWAAVRVPVAQASGTSQVTLDIPGYLQTNSFCCGAVCAAMVVRYFNRRISFGSIYAAIEPDPESGTNTIQVKKGLLACGIDAVVRRRLKFQDVIDAIERDSLIMVSIHNPGATSRHWAVIYGYGRHPDLLFVAGNSVPLIGRNPVARRQFQCCLWDPKGNGIICSRGTRSRAIARPKTSTRWK